jgi:quercetin dioxygenase-like cupin family protein
MTARHVWRCGDADWRDPMGEAAGSGVERAYLAQGDAGFYAQLVRMPPDFTAPVHSHDHAEIFTVLEGSCTFDGVAMGRHDVTVVEAGQPYGFVAGGDGITFLVVRTGAAGFRVGS